MLLLSDVSNQPSVVLVETPIEDISTAVDIVTLTTAKPAFAEPAVNTYSVFTGSASKAKLPAATALDEMDSLRVHNMKHYDLTMYKTDGSTLVAVIPPGMEKSFEISGGEWAVI